MFFSKRVFPGCQGKKHVFSSQPWGGVCDAAPAAPQAPQGGAADAAKGEVRRRRRRRCWEQTWGKCKARQGVNAPQATENCETARRRRRKMPIGAPRAPGITKSAPQAPIKSTGGHSVRELPDHPNSDPSYSPSALLDARFRLAAVVTVSLPTDARPSSKQFYPPFQLLCAAPTSATPAWRRMRRRAARCVAPSPVARRGRGTASPTSTAGSRRAGAGAATAGMQSNIALQEELGGGGPAVALLRVESKGTRQRAACHSSRQKQTMWRGALRACAERGRSRGAVGSNSADGVTGSDRSSSCGMRDDACQQNLPLTALRQAVNRHSNCPCTQTPAHRHLHTDTCTQTPAHRHLHTDTCTGECAVGAGPRYCRLVFTCRPYRIV
eukprot:gene22646-biopygen23752